MRRIRDPDERGRETKKKKEKKKEVGDMVGDIGSRHNMIPSPCFKKRKRRSRKVWRTEMKGGKN